MAAKTKEPKQATLDAELDAINKELGPRTIIRLGDAPIEKVEVIPTGVLALDRAIQAGGWPKGRIVEILGPSGAGKSTLVLHAIAGAQKLGGKCLLADIENAFDAVYARAVGVDVDDLYAAQGETAEQVLDAVLGALKTKAFALIVLDSIAGLTPRAELEGQAGQANVGLMARLLGQSLRRWNAAMTDCDTILMCVNQYRASLSPYGPPEIPSGGRALPYFASVRVDLRKKDTTEEGGVAVSNEVRAKVLKNRVGAPFRECRFDIEFGRGVSREGGVLDLAVEAGIIAKGGAWFTYGDQSIGQGREKAKAWLADNPEQCDEIERKVRDHYSLH